MWPLILAAAAKTLGSLAGGIGQSQDTDTGMHNFRTNAESGTNVLNSGLNTANQAFNPYTSAGQTGQAGQLAAIQGRTQATQPTLTAANPNSVQSWLNPNAAYQQQQAMKQAQSAGMASGAMGGGMLKALAQNAGKQAAGSWNDAYNQMLQANNQNFGQQQQQYQNTNEFQQQQIGNFGDVANRGLSAVGQNQNLAGQYNAGINQNYNNIAANEMSGWGKKGQIFNDTATALGNNIGGGISSSFGGQ